ncbi:MAG TPA: glucoamylase family protein [Cellvibrio sp.]|nr:glucoamylase family protein [Cellvibrio sp.]
MKLNRRKQKSPDIVATALSRADDKLPPISYDPDLIDDTPTLAQREELSPLSRPKAWFLNILQRFYGWGSEHFQPMDNSELTPLRAELFSADQMEQHGKLLASQHRLNRYGMHSRLLKRLDENEEVLIASCETLMGAVKAKSRIAPAGEWLLDNFYLIEDQIRLARQHFPKRYSRELPRLATGPSRGLPRVYDLALEVIAHGDGRVDAVLLSRFISAYQTVTALTLGELWAIPIMLRLALIENLRRVAARLTEARVHVNQAQDWANAMIDTAENDPKSLIMVVADMARSEPPMVSPFVAEFSRRLQGHGPALALPLTWVKERLAESSLTIEQMILSENQQHAADQVSIGNSIGSLRFLGATDWREFVESMSVVEQVLRKDRDNIYSNMDFATRDSYRQVIDRLAKRIRISEEEVARAAVILADMSVVSDEGSQPHKAHVGYYLVDKGLTRLEHIVKARLPLVTRLRRCVGRVPLLLHVGSIFLLTLLFSSGLLLYAINSGIEGWQLWLLGVASALASSQLASSLTNWFAILLVTPKLLPRMDFSRGLPANMRSLVVIPTMLTSAESIDELLEALEVRFLGNRDDYLHFALLTDFCDATNETAAADQRLIERAGRGIELLNEKYAGDENNRFFLFHRPRRWNPKEKKWIGYERKRGKLADLNKLLRSDPSAASCFSVIVGDIRCLTGVKYVITLDTDTQLPRDSAREFIGAMAHPLNRPRYDKSYSRVVGGYGILQPRMAASLTGNQRSRYALLYGLEPGIDPYTRSVSDVYQDLFDEGSFIGKGIYDVDAFEMTLKDRFPENRILSHDLLEGCYTRSGLLSDVQLYEENPTTYTADVSRRERWVRGDWQISSWLFGRVPGFDGKSLRNPLSALSRWKILDNLVRSLAPVALLLMLLLGWWLSANAWVWTLAVVGIVLIPSWLIAFVDIFRCGDEVLFWQHVGAVLQSAKRNFAQAAFRIACLPHEAVFTTEAIMRSMGRLLFTHRLLLEWNPYEEQNKKAALSLSKTFCFMWSAPAIALVATAGMLLVNPISLFQASPILVLWFIAPALAWWVSQPLARAKVKLTPEQIVFLRKISRKTWAFFERFVDAENNWLPPDNFQEQPGPVVAYRTSPTNMGISLLANVTAYDFGYIPSGVMLDRLARSLNTMGTMERHQGHFFNWYDTRSLQCLPPRYISSVDSGNLVGHLLTLRAALSAQPDEKIVAQNIFAGLLDTLHILMDLPLSLQALAKASIASLHYQLITAIAVKPASLHATYKILKLMLKDAEVLTAQLRDRTAEDDDFSFWVRLFGEQVKSAYDELLFMAPWVELVIAIEGLPQFSQLDAIPNLSSLATAKNKLLTEIDERLRMASGLGGAERQATAAEQFALKELRGRVALGCEHASERIALIEKLIEQLSDFANVEYEFLYDRSRHLLAVGYNIDEFRRDNSFYDLLASEARLTNFVGIAQGHLSQESWFALGRLRTATGGEPTLVSWSGSMFEYLMPNLVMPSYEGTLLDQTCRSAVARQIAYGNQRQLPWGISESGYNTVDAGLNYQYHAFGVPGLGLKRGLAEDTVIAPYASALALMFAPAEACSNLQRLASMGVEGRYGFYEAVDYTPARLNRGQSSAIVGSYMAHHQGMSFLSLSYFLHDQPMQKRFESDPQFQATLLLLQERIPKTSVFHNHVAEHAEGMAFFDVEEPPIHRPMSAETPVPEVQLLSNGRYHLMVTNAGGGYSRWKELAVTRWREDSTCDNWGSFIYLHDVDSNYTWSTSHQPTLKRADSYEAMFSEWRAEYRRRDQGIESYSEIVVSPEDDIELRRVRLTNRSRYSRTLEITSYGEVVLATQAADIMQTTFGNLFVQTEILADRHAILCTRRPRSEEEHTPWMFHLLAAQGVDIEEISYETDRMKFIGRGRTLAWPQALDNGNPLSGSSGSVLDPIVAIRCRVTLAAEQSATLDFVSGVSDNRAATLALVDKYQDRHFADRVFDLASTHGGVTLRQINSSESEALLYRRLARSVLFANPLLRAEPNVLSQNRRGQSGLWSYAISGDLPIVLLKISSADHIGLAKQLIQCHTYWRLKGLAVDLVIWNEDHVGYRQHLHDLIIGLIATGTEAHSIDRPGGIFVRSAEQISHEDRILLQSVARAIIVDSRGTLEEQLNRRGLADSKVSRLLPSRSYRPEPPVVARANPELLLDNNLGGFNREGNEYVISTHPGKTTPVPWVNVLANPHFGSVISESGLSYTWSENAHEYRLTPWSDDPVAGSGGEAIYLRDEETGYFWSPTPLPRRPNSESTAAYTTRHGFGYSVFEHSESGISTELWVYVDLQQTVKYSVLKIRNDSGRQRRISATGYVEWVLGDLRAKSSMHLVTEIDASSGALFARNSYNSEFSGRVAFFDVDDPSRTLSGDRTEFLGRNGSLANPDAMSRARLSGRVGAALDPCGAIQVPVELGSGQEREIIFRLGAGQDLEHARTLAQRLRHMGTARAALQAVREYWQHTLSGVTVQTPDRELNLLANGWLLYQTLACRIWARSGFYQSGGAFGFRDQLQDSMALLHTQPQLVREHLLRCAQRQYPEGDVQHWWHPPLGRGVRTRCSDDYLWLPLVTCRYVQATGDLSVLDEVRPFLEGRSLGAEEESYYDLPGPSNETASLYQHCVRAIEHGLRFGERGLPLMGSGDWNDGMNLVGIHGKGESVWLGFFLYDVLQSFAQLAQQYNDPAFVERCKQQAEQLRQNIENNAWDGKWYRRAYFDDGMPLGSASNTECAIDSISQSWSVLSRAGSAERTKLAMASLDQHLVRRDSGIIQLLDPPFDTAPMNPGYIKGYVPGVRENGGQYTHAAVWAAMAFAALGDSQRAWELLALINPLNHTRTSEDVSVYKAEPYVVAADVYAIAPHTGRGGWSWYTGSAGLTYRLIMESLLGIKRTGNHLSIAPCLPKDWQTYSIRYRAGETIYDIRVMQGSSGDHTTSARVTLDGTLQSGDSFELLDDGREHRVEVSLARAQ